MKKGSLSCITTLEDSKISQAEKSVQNVVRPEAVLPPDLPKEKSRKSLHGSMISHEGEGFPALVYLRWADICQSIIVRWLLC